MNHFTSEFRDTKESFPVLFAQKCSRSFHLIFEIVTGVKYTYFMTRATAPTAIEEAALLERAKSFANEENIKVNSLIFLYFFNIFCIKSNLSFA